MTKDTVLHLAIQALTLTLKVSLPILLAGLVVGLVISLFQAVTQIQEATLTFIPKILVTAGVIALAGPWMLDQVVAYTHDLFESIPTMIK
ncbi:MAG: flagellar biosynthesis protein FliQ [Thermoleophilia bacterium]